MASPSEVPIHQVATPEASAVAGLGVKEPGPLMLMVAVPPGVRPEAVMVKA